jgi:dTDP-4-amino-4,6-dideoxygalactose transaminase
VSIRRIPIAKPVFDKRDFEAVLKPLKSGWVVQGPFVNDFEERFASFTGAKYAVATSSCTTAQLISSMCIGLKAEDEVIVPSFTWISPLILIVKGLRKRLHPRQRHYIRLIYSG